MSVFSINYCFLGFWFDLENYIIHLHVQPVTKKGNTIEDYSYQSTLPAKRPFSPTLYSAWFSIFRRCRRAKRPQSHRNRLPSRQTNRRNIPQPHHPNSLRHNWSNCDNPALQIRHETNQHSQTNSTPSSNYPRRFTWNFLG